MKKPIILASESERRKHLLGTLMVPFEVIKPATQETFYQTDPERTVIENARLKNEWCLRIHPEALIISADTVTALQGNCVTKPDSTQEAASFFKRFSGKTHSVLTAVALSCPSSAMEVHIIKSNVSFKVLTDVQIGDYLAKVNPLDKAGGYDINQYPELIIESFTGSRTNIMGLPLHVVENWLRQFGYCTGTPAPG